MTSPPGAAAHPAALPRVVLVLVGLAAATIALSGLRGISGIVGPAFLAVVLCIAVSPVRNRLVDLGAPRWVGSTAAVLVVYLMIVVFGGAMLVSAARFATLVPQYQDELGTVLDEVGHWLRSVGVSDAQIDKVLGSFDLSRLAGLVTGILSDTLSLLTNLFFLVTLVLFVVFDAGSFGAALEGIRAERPALVEALESFAHGTRTYLVVSSVFGLIVAVIDTVLLYALGVPGALLWGLLAFVTNYVPNIGFVLGLLPPAVLALLEGGPGLMVAVIAAYSVINVVIQSVIQPKMVGDSVGLSASITFLSLVLWAWVLGPVGAVLAVPLTLLVRSLFVDVDPRTRWIAGLIGSPSAPGKASEDPPPPATPEATTP
jgi:AI-2 transport protein TqsA